MILFSIQKERELCGDPESGDVGTIARVTAALAERSAHCAHTAMFYSLQSRVDYVPSVHLPSQTRRLATAVDEALREAYARALGTDILNLEGDFPEQLDPTFTRDRFSLRHSQGGGGFRPAVERIPSLNSLFSALPAISRSTAQAPLWLSLAPVVGGRGVYDKDSKPEEQFWATFFASGCRTAREMQEETKRIRRLRDEALELASLAANPPQSAVFDRPNEGIGYCIGKVQKRAFDEIKVFRAKGLERRADNPPPCRPAAHGLGVFGQRLFFKPVRRGGALAIDAILERQIPSRGADALRSPAHLPQVLHQPTTRV